MIIFLTCHCCVYYVRDIPQYSALYFSFRRQTIATALITSMLDTATLFIISHLRILQNLRVFRTVSSVFSFCVTLEITSLASVQSRIISKLCTIAYLTPSTGDPSYLFSISSSASKPRELHSSGFKLQYAHIVITNASTRVFPVSIPTLCPWTC